MIKYNHKHEEVFRASNSDKFGKGFGKFQNVGNKRGLGFHNYGPAYSLILGYLEGSMESVDLLEIGVKAGGSMEVWKQLPIINKVVGIDIDKQEVPGTTFYHANAYTPKMINILNKNHGGFDFIIDDGPHTWKTQKYFLENYYSLLKPKGIMVCEDFKIGSNNKELTKLKNKLGVYILDVRPNSKGNGKKHRPGSVLLLRFK
jgi:hypothetical protein